MVVGIEIDPNDPDAIAQLHETIAGRLRAVADKLGLTEEQRAGSGRPMPPSRRSMRPSGVNGGISAAGELKALGSVLTPEQLEKVQSYIEDRVESLKDR